MDREKLFLAERLLKEAYASEDAFRVSSGSDVWALPRLRKAARAKQESFYVVTLDGAHKVIKVHEVTRGLINRTVVHPREVFRVAILDNSADIIVAHNHTSGSLLASPEDRDITQSLYDASQVIGISLLDHVIVSKLGYYSMLEHGELKPADLS
jgi:DNA repair protein RadC